MKKHGTTILLFLVFIIGLSLLLYPSFSDYWNSFHQSQVISAYAEQISSMDRDEYNDIWNSARAYNESLVDRSNSFLLSENQKLEYSQLLNLGGNGIMGYIEIPHIGVILPIYHGTDEAVL